MTSATPAKQWCSPAQRMSGLAGAGLRSKRNTTPASFIPNWPQAYSSQPVVDAPALPPVQPTACGDLLPAAGRFFAPPLSPKGLAGTPCACVFPEFKESSNRVSVPRFGRRSRAVRLCPDFGQTNKDSRAINHRGSFHVRNKKRRHRRFELSCAVPLSGGGVSTFDGQAGGVCHRHSGVIDREMAARRNAAIRLSLCPADRHVRRAADCSIHPQRRLGAGGCA